METDFLKAVMLLCKQKKWREILHMGEQETNAAEHLIWVWPSEENLHFIHKYLICNNCSRVISVGCGCGLFEWLLNISTGVTVIGYEVNQEWWKSKYATPQFIPLHYAEPFPKNCPVTRNEDALLFCYFNNHEAFITYVNMHRGKVLFIIGPGDGRYTHTDPQPFKPNFENTEWKLVDSQEVRDTKDYIAVYVRK